MRAELMRQYSAATNGLYPGCWLGQAADPFYKDVQSTVIPGSAASRGTGRGGQLITCVAGYAFLAILRSAAFAFRWLNS